MTSVNPNPIASTFKRKNRGIRPAVAEGLEGRVLLTTVVVNTTEDGLFPDGSGTISLRNAVAIANSSASPTTITFDPNVFNTAKTIVLNGSALTLTATTTPVDITGPATGVTVSGNNASAVFQTYCDTNISAVTVTGGNGFNGGGIAVEQNTLTLANVALIGNSAGEGGGLYDNGQAILSNVTISGNSASSFESGGGIYIDLLASATLRNVTIVNNVATGQNGGGILNTGTLSLRNVTIVGNTAPGFGEGGGLQTPDGQTDIANSIISGNAAGSGPDVSGSVTSRGYNLIGTTAGSSGWFSLDRTGVNPDLGTLGFNGGFIETMLPDAGSPAIDNGFNGLVPMGLGTDARGMPRIRNGTVDIGAVEIQTGSVTLSQSQSYLLATSGSISRGASVTFVGTVTSGLVGGASPTGVVTFFDGSTALGTASLLTDGTATFSTSSLPPGDNVITASYGGDSAYASSVSAPITVTVSGQQTSPPPTTGIAVTQNLGSISKGSRVVRGLLTSSSAALSSDYYSFSLPGASTVKITLSGLKSDADLNLLDSGGAVIASSRRHGRATEFIGVGVGLGGLFYVNPYLVTGNSTPFKLQLSIKPARIKKPTRR